MDDAEFVDYQLSVTIQDIVPLHMVVESSACRLYLAVIWRLFLQVRDLN